MDINLSIPTEDLDIPTRIDLLAQIAEGATREAGGGPRDAVLALMRAAALLSVRNGGKAPDMAEIIPTAREIARRMGAA